MIDLIKFVISGWVDDLPISPSSQKTKEAWGDPLNWGRPYKNILIFQYGEVEITFHDQDFYMLAIYNRSQPTSIITNASLLDKDVDSVVVILNDLGVEWTENKQFHTKERPVLELSSNLNIYFNSNGKNVYAIMTKPGTSPIR